MRPSDCVGCKLFPCANVNHQGYVIPAVEITPETVRIVLISEAAPANLANYYYAQGSPLFEQTTVEAFRDAGADVSSMQDILDLGVYLTTAAKCGKVGYGIGTPTIKECSHILERELDLFPNATIWLLMGDVSIKAVNEIARRAGRKRVIPAAPTYKIRGGEFSFQGKRVFPSYLQAGPSFFIEKNKRKMIAEAITTALRLVS